MGDPRRPIVARPIKVFLKTHTVEKIQTMGDLTRCPIVARPIKVFLKTHTVEKSQTMDD